MTTAELALLVSFASLSISIWSAVVARRATQFKRLGELRTKAADLRWQMRYRLDDVKKAARDSGLMDKDGTGAWSETITRLEELLQQATDRERFFADVYASRKWRPLVLSESTIEDWHAQLDVIAASVDVSRKELVPQVQEWANQMSELMDEHREIVKELIRRDTQEKSDPRSDNSV